MGSRADSASSSPCCAPDFAKERLRHRETARDSAPPWMLPSSREIATARRARAGARAQAHAGRQAVAVLRRAPSTSTREARASGTEDDGAAGSLAAARAEALVPARVPMPATRARRRSFPWQGSDRKTRRSRPRCGWNSRTSRGPHPVLAFQRKPSRSTPPPTTKRRRWRRTRGERGRGRRLARISTNLLPPGRSGRARGRTSVEARIARSPIAGAEDEPHPPGRGRARGAADDEPPGFLQSAAERRRGRIGSGAGRTHRLGGRRKRPRGRASQAIEEPPRR